MIALETIRYCNECPFKKRQIPQDYFFCSLQKYLGKSDEIRLPNEAYTRPPENCSLRDEGISLEIEEKYRKTKTPQVPENKSKTLESVD